jgi:hypothetical protein
MDIPVLINNKAKVEELDNGILFCSVTWNQLLPAISESIKLRDDEVIDGFIVNENGLKVKLSRKRGRKNN